MVSSVQKVRKRKRDRDRYIERDRERETERGLRCWRRIAERGSEGVSKALRGRDLFSSLCQFVLINRVFVKCSDIEFA